MEFLLEIYGTVTCFFLWEVGKNHGMFFFVFGKLCFYFGGCKVVKTDPFFFGLELTFLNWEVYQVYTSYPNFCGGINSSFNVPSFQGDWTMTCQHGRLLTSKAGDLNEMEGSQPETSQPEMDLAWSQLVVYSTLLETCRLKRQF